MKHAKTALPYLFYYSQVVGLALLGLFTSAYLTYTHYKNHTDLSYASFCAISQAVNCDTVAQSPWSILWGLPVAIWGILAYSLFLLILIPLRRRDGNRIAGWSLFTALSLLASSCSVYLAILSGTKIHSWCLLCMLTYTINFLLTFSSWIVFRRFSTAPFFASFPSAAQAWKDSTLVKLGLIVLSALLLLTRLLIPAYWEQGVVASNPRVATGVTSEGYPWIGATDPQFVIEEFTDYQCFQCKKVHFFLRQLINQNPDRIRLVHRHYPLDHEFNRILVPDPFHVGSGKLSLTAIVASKHDAFWLVNDALYMAIQSKEASINIDQFAGLMRISADKLASEMYLEKNLKHLQHDIVEGLQYGFTGTPSFVVNGEVYKKTLPSELLQEIIK